MKLTAYISVIAFVLIILTSVGFTIASYQNEQTFEVIVTDKEVKTSSDSSRYLIFAEVDGETRVFQNTDALFKGKFNSSDLYAEIEPGEKYTFTTIGYRVNFLSMYENIIEIETK